jgi:lipoprotein Spr
VYDIKLPRTAQNQYNSTSKIKKDDLSQGDLVFFNTTGGISHVGVYLANNKFVHASVSSGVMVSDMEDAYFKRRYVGATRVK